MGSRRTPTLEAAFGRVVREARDQASISRGLLAELADVHRTYVSMLERGQRCRSLTTIAKLANALGSRPSEGRAAWEERVGWRN